MFRVKFSDNFLSDGLFATRTISRGTLVRLNITNFYTAPQDDQDNLAYYLPRDADDASPCLVDGKLATVKAARQACKSSILHTAIFACATNDPLMKANDRGWRTNAQNTKSKYQVRIKQNSFEFILSVDSITGVNGIYAHFTRSVNAGEEICSTYGWDYWQNF